MFCFNKRLIVVMTVVLVMGAVLFVAFLNRENLSSRGITPGAVTPSALPRLGSGEIAARLLQWLNNTRTENGGYAEGEICIAGGKCDPLAVDNRIGAPGLWARYRSYVKTKGFEAMAIMNQDIKTYTDPNKVPTIQPNFWNCKLLFELWKSTDFTPDQKDDLQVICARSIYNAFDLTFPETAQLEETAKLQIVQEMDGKRLSSELVFLEPVDSEKVFEYAVNSSERVSMWEWAGDREDLRQAHLFLMGAVEALRATEDTHLQGELSSIVGIASLDLNRAAPSPAFANYAAFLFRKYKGSSCGTVENCSLRAYFYNELHKLNKKEEYKAGRDSVLNALYDERFDSEGLTGYSAGRQAFYDKEQKNRYWMVPNAVLAGLMFDL